MRKRQGIHVMYRKAKKVWEVKENGILMECFRLREEARKHARHLALKIVARCGVASVYFHRKDGEITEERTYPRSSDPHPPKG